MDTTFDPVTINGIVWSLFQQADGKIVFGGNFSTFGGVAKKGIARANPGGTFDTTFNPSGSGVTGKGVRSIAQYSDGRLLIGGAFQAYNGSPLKFLGRLDANGNLDPNPIGWEPNEIVTAVIFTPDSRIVFGGDFDMVGEHQQRQKLGRLSANEQWDLSPAPTANGIVNAVVVQPDGKILIGGNFTVFKGVALNRFARLNEDGSLDSAFNNALGQGFNNAVQSIALQPDGRFIIGGYFTSFNGIARNRIIRLTDTGTIDTSFDPGAGASDYILAVALHCNNKILIGGNFTSVNGTARNRIAALNENGSIDTSFDPGSGFDATVHSIVIQPDGKILVGGWFTMFNGIPRSRIARLHQ